MNSGEAAWRQVLQLGERLLALKSSSGLDRPNGGVRDIGGLFLDQRHLIATTTGKLLEAEVQLWLSRKLLPFSGAQISGALQEQFPAEPESPTMRQALEDTRTGHFNPKKTFSKDGGCITLAAPLTFQQEGVTEPLVLGVLQVERPENEPFDDRETALLAGLATQAAIALHASYQTAVEQWRIRQLTLVRQVSAKIANVRDLDELSRQVAGLILDTFDYYYVAIFTHDPEQAYLHFRASAGGKRDLPDSGGALSLKIRVGDGIIGQVAQTGQEIVANDVSREARFQFYKALADTRAEATLPLIIETRVLGVLDVQSDQLNDFQETDMLVLRALAGSIAVAIEGAQLFHAFSRRAEQLTIVSEVSNAIASILDEEQLLEELVNLIQKRLGFPYVHLFSVHPGRRKVFFEAGSDHRRHTLKDEPFAYDLDDPRGMIPWVARQAVSLLANDVAAEPLYRPSALPPDNTQSELAVPIIFGKQVLGVIDLQSDRLNAFDKDDVFVLETLADSVAVALRNAFLYRSELWRRQVADSLREVAGLLSADVDQDQVLAAILAEMKRSLPCDVAAIWLLDESSSEFETAGIAHLHLAAVLGPDDAPGELSGADERRGAGELRGASSLEDLIRHFEAQPDQPANGWLLEALTASEPLVRNEQTEFEPFGSALGYAADYSAIAAPLRVGEQPLGVLSLAHRTAGRYGSEARAMTATFASYAAVAIENTRLFEAAHEQAWVSTVLVQVAEATQNLTNLNELLSTVARITPMLVGVKSSALYMWDETVEAFAPAAASGLTPEQETAFERWRYAPGDAEVFDRLLQEKRPVLIHSRTENPKLPEVTFTTTEILPDAELMILTPLLARGEVLGALLVDYSADMPNASSLETLENLFDERLAILQGIAHQTAVAVENIHLMKAQKEEAYVSVALLQVAQAVVSSNDLDEILGAIVRITPILVGVRRSLIYLWDNANQVFRLAQSYGIPRNAGKTVYAPQEFEILENARKHDRLMAYPLKDDLFSGEGENLDPPESWTRLRLENLDLIESYLVGEARLLLAFPLSVKGEVVGVFLVEEPEGGAGGAIRRLREKRLEITTGISQQAALAIQNDRLQFEMLVRERMEQELLLARQIQRTFLPHSLPELPGWSLDVRWRTAREVGGDFYDIFDLPDGRLGLVMADVADKGMPAALFMVLTRTLVRATVQSATSPAEVLRRVNDALVPDAQQGMFITLVYAVLDLKTGELEYANAGHNPPLLLRNRSLSVEQLEKSGMALGVLDGSQMEERQVQLEPGDYLVFYTDGVTEAFSPEGEMYGEERLEATIRGEADWVTDLNTEATSGTAGEMLEAIDDSVIVFVGDALPYDDLTLMVLRRLSD